MIEYALTEKRVHLVENRGLKTLCGLDLETSNIISITNTRSRDWSPETCSNCLAIQASLDSMRNNV